MSNNTPQIKYDVFVSLRGDDIRHGFLSHLTKAFARKQINTFVDDKLRTGVDDISSSLFEAIEGSSISLIIFSENYASSPWCLEELVKILECNEKYGQIAIPVFYKVEPSDVRHQRKSYENALLELEKMYDLPRVQIWRQALKNSANLLSGITSLKYGNEADLLEEIINRVLMRLRKSQINTKGLIGMEKPTADLESMLCRESKKVRVIGIWGLEGIGKTTIAEVIFNKKCFEYGGSCFLSKVKDELQKHGRHSLKEKLFTQLLAEDVKTDTPNLLPSDIHKRIGRMKVLIVLDDVSTNGVENIFGTTLDWLHSGSRIIITTRDKQVLLSNKADDIYHVGELSSSEALELFNMSAFNQNHLDLSQRVVNFAKGNPLVLKVLGGLLSGKGKEVWESELDNTISIEKVHSVMRPIYDDLDPNEKTILLDVACYFYGMKIKVSSFIMILKDHENDNSVVVGLERLKDRALVIISKDDKVSIHGIIQGMCLEIVKESQAPWRWSRLLDPYDILQVLENNEGTGDTRSVVISYSSFRNLDFSLRLFVKMSKLQFLYIDNGIDGTKGWDLFPQWSKVWRNLKVLFWIHCPLKSFPRCISVESLIRLDLVGGRLRTLWHRVKNLVNLKEVSIRYCVWLEELPDFSKAINLELLLVEYCVNLKRVHPSIYSLNKLHAISLEGCISLTEFTNDTRLSPLQYIKLDGCQSLRNLIVISDNITELRLMGIPTSVLPSSFACQMKLEYLDLSQTEYESLPSSIQDLTRLRQLGIESCVKLRSIPVLPLSLEKLYASGCSSLKTVLFPLTAAEQFKENRKTIVLLYCLNLDERSLRDIELNAQINLMKLSYQHSSTPEHDDHKFDRAVYIYPGCKGPKWLEYKTSNGEIIIDPSPAQISPLLGFIFCFILDEEDSGEYGGKVEFQITITDGEGEKACYTMDFDVATGHVCMIYDKKCSHYITSAIKSHTRFKIKVATQPVESEMDEVVNLKLIEFGVSLVNSLAYDSFIQSNGIF